jgi:hypothetical protein
MAATCVNDQWAAVLLPDVIDCLSLSEALLSGLVEKRIISTQEYSNLRSMTESKAVNRLLSEVLPSRPPETFAMFCELLRDTGQDDLADRLEERDGQTRAEPKTIEQLWQEKELLEERLASLERKAAVDMQTTRALVEECASLRRLLNATHGASSTMPTAPQGH